MKFAMLMLLWSPAAFAGPFDGTWTVDHDASVPLFDKDAHPWIAAVMERFHRPPPEVTVDIKTTPNTMSMVVMHDDKRVERNVRLDGEVRPHQGPFGWMVDERHVRHADGSLSAEVRTPLHEVTLTLVETDDPDTIHITIEVEGAKRQGLRVLHRQ